MIGNPCLGVCPAGETALIGTGPRSCAGLWCFVTEAPDQFPALSILRFAMTSSSQPSRISGTDPSSRSV